MHPSGLAVPIAPSSPCPPALSRLRESRVVWIVALGDAQGTIYRELTSIPRRDSCSDSSTALPQGGTPRGAMASPSTEKVSEAKGSFNSSTTSRTCIMAVGVGYDR